MLTAENTWNIQWSHQYTKWILSCLLESLHFQVHELLLLTTYLRLACGRNCVTSTVTIPLKVLSLLSFRNWYLKFWFCRSNPLLVFSFTLNRSFRNAQTQRWKRSTQVCYITFLDGNIYFQYVCTIFGWQVSVLLKWKHINNFYLFSGSHFVFIQCCSFCFPVHGLLVLWLCRAWLNSCTLAAFAIAHRLNRMVDLSAAATPWLLLFVHHTHACSWCKSQ